MKIYLGSSPFENAGFLINMGVATLFSDHEVATV
jgi:hypothetical protein